MAFESHIDPWGLKKALRSQRIIVNIGPVINWKKKEAFFCLVVDVARHKILYTKSEVSMEYQCEASEGRNIGLKHNEGLGLEIQVWKSLSY